MSAFQAQRRAHSLDYAAGAATTKAGIKTSSLGLYGFVFSKRALAHKLWIPFLVFYLLAGMFYEPLSSVDMRQGMSDSGYYISIAIGHILSLPAYYGLYQFGKSK